MIGPASSPLGIGRAVRPLAVGWASLSLLTMLAYIVGFVAPLAVLAWLLGTGVAIYALYDLFRAKSQALDQDQTPTPCWKGLARIVSWNPTEGVLFLKNKQIDFVDSNAHDGGGIRVIFPALGEELLLRMPLEIRFVDFEDSAVLTREYVPLTVRTVIYWRVADLSRVYLLISREVHKANDHGRHSIQLERRVDVAEHWLRTMAEEKTRAIISRVGTGLLIADQLASDLAKTVPEAASFVNMETAVSEGYRSATEGLGEMIKTEFQSVVREYGLEIHRVALQEVKLPPEVYAAAVETCTKAYLPLKARAEALQRKLMLQAEADVIGNDALGMKEIAGNIPALAFQDFLGPLFQEMYSKRQTAASVPSR